MKKEMFFVFLLAAIQLGLFIGVTVCLLIKAFPPENEKFLFLVMGATINSLNSVGSLINTIKDYYYGSSVKNEKIEIK